jgi:hypothetical protein
VAELERQVQSGKEVAHAGTLEVAALQSLLADAQARVAQGEKLIANNKEVR